MEQQSLEIALGLEILDALSVVTPRGWSCVRLHFATHEQNQLYLHTVSFPRSRKTNEQQLPKPDFSSEQETFLVSIGEAMLQLVQTVFPQQALYDCTLVIDREQPDPVCEVTLNSETYRFSLPQSALNSLIFTEQLLQDFLSVEQNFESTQKDFAEKIRGHDDWSYDQSTCELTLSKGVLPWGKYTAYILGTYGYENESWLWSWANKSLHPESVKLCKQFQQQQQKSPDSSAYLRHTLHCSENLAAKIAAAVCVKLNAIGLYPASYGPGALYLAVMAPITNSKNPSILTDS